MIIGLVHTKVKRKLAKIVGERRIDLARIPVSTAARPIWASPSPAGVQEPPTTSSQLQQGSFSVNDYRRGEGERQREKRCPQISQIDAD
jgi:hypothetical protein